MPVTYLLRVVGSRAGDVHRTRNFAEELHLDLKRSGLGTTTDPDAMTTELLVTIPKPRDLGAARSLIDRVLRKHLMVDDVQIDRHTAV
jgi:hypothetical protein